MGVVASTSSSFAGDFLADSVAPYSGGGSGDWAKSLKTIGTIYKNKQNPYIQEIKIKGRAHYQWGYTDGSIQDGVNNSGDFSGSTQELRRFRVGTSIKFLNGFKASVGVDFEDGSANDNSIAYGGIDSAALSYNFGDVGAFEDLTLGYGFYKFNFGGEELKSSNKIKTIERSLLNNFFSGGRVTGARLEGTYDDVDLSFGVFNTDGDNEVFGDWNGGVVLQLAADFDALGGNFNIQGVYRDSTGDVENESVDYDWAFTTSYGTKVGPFDLFLNGTYGSNDDGDVYGVVILPSVELIKNKLEAVVRYTWTHSDSDQLSFQSRNTRNVASANGFSSFSGDDYHSIYGGLNYFIADHNAKLLVGIEYEDLDGSDVGSTATTIWGAVRVSF